MGRRHSVMTGQHRFRARQLSEGARAAAVSITVLLGLLGSAAGQASKAGGAGHALLFADHAPVLKSFKNFASDAFTFEAWMTTSDFCHRGGIMSYALDSKASDAAKRSADFNHFVVFDPYQVIACHDFEYLDLWPDRNNLSCMASFNHSWTANFVGRANVWRHIAVTWTSRGNGRTRIYQDGLLMAEATSGKTSPLQSGGAFMLGGEQDCYGGCTDSSQSFYGLMDEVRLWRVERSQKDILKWMRADGPGLDPKRELLAYWKFDDPDTAGGSSQLVAKDSSGSGNDLPLVSPPLRRDVTIQQSLATGSLALANNYAFNPRVSGFPTADFSVEFWARTPKVVPGGPSETNAFMTLLSYATHTQQGDSFLGGAGDSVFTDDAIRIEKYYEEYGSKSQLHYLDIRTAGTISVHINSNRNGNGRRFENWLDYAVGWTDDAWHHIALTWAAGSGEARLYWDGQEQTPFWAARQGKVEAALPSAGGVAKQLAAGTTRLDHGSLVLGQNQECYGACFSPEQALDGDLAAVRIWSRVLPQSEVRANMFVDAPAGASQLAAVYTFKPETVVPMSIEAGSKAVVADARGGEGNKLELWADAPRYEYSYAPLMDARSGAPLAAPTAGARGHALYLSDQQTLVLTDFEDWPGEAITVEFWMLSADRCRKGVPFSYATGAYEQGDNSFLILNYNDWGVSVMEDEGQLADHTAGIGATDGAWHHIAVSWQSSDGATALYDNGRKVWAVERAKGKRMPSGGTLVVGREQDCMGGCFDSAAGSTGKLDNTREYGVQDFFGQIDELRVWRTVRSEEQIRQGMTSAEARVGQGGGNGGVSESDPNLVAYWKFDEGQGYLVKDATGKGHDMRLTSQPNWMVVREMSECGNGVLEASEQCDDGNRVNGDGCSSSCQIEAGWECTGTSPAECWRQGDPSPHPDPTRLPIRPGSADAGSGAGSGSGKSSHVGVIIASVLFALMLLACLGAGLLYRETLSEAFPVVGNSVSALRARFGARQRSTLYQGLDALDPEERLDLAPEFVGASAPRHAQGPYTPLGGPETTNGHAGH